MTAEVAMEPMEPTVPAHGGPWTEEEYLALPEQQTQRIELIDGELVVSPVGRSSHQTLGSRLWRELDQGLPERFVPYHEANVRLRTGRIVIPDLVVTTNLDDDWLVVEAAEVALVGEVVSPTSRAMDRILKPALFAEAGVGWYLRVEQEPVLQLILQRRKGDTYLDHSRAGDGEHLDIPDLGCAIDTATLGRRGSARP